MKILGIIGVCTLVGGIGVLLARNGSPEAGFMAFMGAISGAVLGIFMSIVSAAISGAKYAAKKATNYVAKTLTPEKETVYNNTYDRHPTDKPSNSSSSYNSGLDGITKEELDLAASALQKLSAKPTTKY
jgi:hypothetical protein